MKLFLNLQISRIELLGFPGSSLYRFYDDFGLGGPALENECSLLPSSLGYRYDNMVYIRRAIWAKKVVLQNQNTVDKIKSLSKWSWFAESVVLRCSLLLNDFILTLYSY